MSEIRSHISYSEWIDHQTCQNFHRLKHIERLGGNTWGEHLTFGTCTHDTCEYVVLEEFLERCEGHTWAYNKAEVEAHFLKNFRAGVKELIVASKGSLNKKTIVDLSEQGPGFLPHVVPALKKKFGEDYQVVDTEYELYHEISPEHKNFKGFVDLALFARERYPILDWKTCSWGWPSRKKGDKLTTYQLVFYKHFFSEQYQVPFDSIDTYFGLLKRTAKKNRVEIFESKIGKRKRDNALAALLKSIEQIQAGDSCKNRKSCMGTWGPCAFFNSEHCK